MPKTKNNEFFSSTTLEEIETRKIHLNEFKNKLNLNDAVILASKRIEEFINKCLDFNKDNINKPLKEITVSFSGGKDSTVLLDLVLKVHKKMKCVIPVVPVYAIEITFPATLKFIRVIVKQYQEEYEYLKDPQLVPPKMPWNDILSKKGYPIYSKQISLLIHRTKNAKTKTLLCKWAFGIDRENTNTSRYKLSHKRLFLLDDKIRLEWPKLLTIEEKEYFKKYNEYYFFSEKCCNYVKGGLKHDNRPSFIGTMADESEMRKRSWINLGCNIFSKNKMKSRPLSLWNADLVWEYIKKNNLNINESYGYDPTKSILEQRLRFDRLGCTSCPFGSAIEQKKIEILEKRGIKPENKYKAMNRFEILNELYPNLYKTQVISTGMYKIIIDMGVKISNDKIYQNLFEKRWEQINKWNDRNSSKNFRHNILRVLCQIENINDYKKKGDKYIWNYSIKDFNDAMSYFKLEKTNNIEVKSIRKEVHEYYERKILKS